MKKYVITKTGEEVKLGDKIACKQERKTSFGTIKTYQEFTVTGANLGTFIRNGIIEVVEEKSPKHNADIGNYIDLAAQKMKCSSEDLIDWLEAMNKVCPKAVLDLLLQTIAIKFYNDDPQAFDDAEEYYSLRPRDGKVGKVYNISSYIPLFKSVEDAEAAREILEDQLKLMYGEQKDC